MLIEPSEINALIKLIDDPDELIHAHVRSKILDYGLDAIPYLERVWDTEQSNLNLKNEKDGSGKNKLRGKHNTNPLNSHGSGKC